MVYEDRFNYTGCSSLNILYCIVYFFSVALCPDPIDIEYGMVTFTGNAVDDTATYTCDLGFELIGIETTTCTLVDANSAAFQSVPPFCRREYPYTYSHFP